MEQVKGQAVLEYVLLLAIVVMAFMGVIKFLEDKDWYKGLAVPLTKDYKNAYQYGHPKADGQKNVAQDPENFRIFVNPPTKK